MFFLVQKSMLDLAQKLVSNHRLLSNPDTGSSQNRRLVVAEHVDLRGAIFYRFFLLSLNLHLLILPALFQSVLYPAQKDQVELTDVLLVSDGEVIAVVVDNGRDH